MTLQVQETELCKLNVQYVAPVDKVKAARSKIVDRIKREKVPVPGFRPGRAPSHIIESRMKATIDSMAAKDLVSEAYNDLLFEHKIKTLFYPKVENQSFDKGLFYCEMTVWKKPDIELKEYKGFNIPKPAVENASDISARILQDLRVKHGESRPYSDGDTVQKDDRITLDIKVECEGQAVPELSQEGMLYQVGQFSDLDENLLGMTPDETRQFKITMKDDVPVEFVRGKVADFTATLHMGMRNEPAPLDDSLAAKIGFSSFAELETYIGSVSNNQIKSKSQNALNQQVFSRLLELNPFEVPAWLVELEAQNAARNRGVEWKELSSEVKSKIFTEAERAVKLSLILDSIRESEPDVSFSERELLNSLRMKVSETGGNPDDFIKKATEDGSIFGIVANMKDSATIEWIIKNSTIID